MDHSYDYLNDIYQKFSILSNLGIYIFIFSILLFGFLTYFFTIKNCQPSFDRPKVSKKRNKKEKVSKIKSVNTELVPKSKIATSDSGINVKVQQNVKESLPTENDDNNSWIPVQKSKKISKNEKKVIKIESTKVEVPLKRPLKPPQRDITEPNHIESEPKGGIVEAICEPPKVPEVRAAVATVLISEETEVATDAKAEAESVGSRPPTRFSDSPTNSVAEDFVVVDYYKSSSEDCVLAGGNLCDTADELVASPTSGAGRKKNKKQQKVISKQLIDAAVVEGDTRPADYPGKSIKVAPKSAGPKKRRPRKDI